MTPLFAIKINIPFLCLSRRVLHEPLCLSTGANRKAMKRRIRDRIRAAVRNPKSVIICVQWSEVRGTVKDEGEPGKAPSRPLYKEAHHDHFSMAAYHLCILCCSALDFASFTEYLAFGFSLSALWSLEKVQMEYISSKVELFLGFAICPHKCNSLFCVYILPNPLWRVWDPLPHHVSFP